MNLRGEERSNASHASVTDPDARLFNKEPGAAAMPRFIGHTLMEKRNGLVVQAALIHADGHGKHKAVLEMINRHSPGATRRLTPAADKRYDRADFVAELRCMVVTPHVARDSPDISPSMDGPTQHLGYAFSRRRFKKTEEPFGCIKTVSMSQNAHCVLDRVRSQFSMIMTARHLSRRLP